MAEITGIAWCDASFNPWWGCTAISVACDHCYAAALDKRTGGDNWGPDKTPRIMSDGNWRNPKRWERNHSSFADQNGGRRRRVFSGSMCDVFDKNAPHGQRDRLWQLIRETPHLDWILVTKRIGNAKSMLPDDWGDGYGNVWLVITVANQEEADRDIQKLLATPARVRGLSMEPLLGPVDLQKPLGLRLGFDKENKPFWWPDHRPEIDWVIVGGESGQNARSMSMEWARSLRDQCTASRVPFFFKQVGGSGAGKGGALLDGQEYKAWPASVNIMPDSA